MLKRKYIFMLIFLIYCTTSIDFAINGARYIKYSALPITLLFWATYRFTLPKSYSGTDSALLILMCWMPVTLFWGNYYLGAKDFLFIASYAIPFLLLKDYGLSIERTFYIYVAIFAASLPSRTFGEISIIDSKALAESSSSFIFGAFALAFLTKKKYVLVFIALVLLLISLKRIALLGYLICALLWFTPTKIRNVLFHPALILIFNIIVVLSIILVTANVFDEQIKNLTGKGLNEFTLGRIEMYSGILDDVMQNPLTLVFGNGAGSAYNKALIYYTGPATQPNLHSDTLKMMYEYGILLFIFFFYRIAYKKTASAQVVVIYMCILFSTDNVLIYADVMFILIYIIFRLEFDDRNRLAADPKALNSAI
jgi:hypothetical protein